jgi:hypothetical protein
MLSGLASSGKIKPDNNIGGIIIKIAREKRYTSISSKNQAENSWRPETFDFL